MPSEALSRKLKGELDLAYDSQVVGALAFALPALGAVGYRIDEYLKKMARQQIEAEAAKGDGKAMKKGSRAMQG